MAEGVAADKVHARLFRIRYKYEQTIQEDDLSSNSRGADSNLGGSKRVSGLESGSEAQHVYCGKHLKGSFGCKKIQEVNVYITALRYE